MYIQNKPASALYKMFIGILAVVGFWLSLHEFGLSAWRLFSTSILLLAAVYYLLSALVLALSRKRSAGQPPCPMLEGLIIVSTTFLCVTTVICHLRDVTFIGAGGWHASLIYFVLPFLALTDWIIFAKKGQWRLVEPFYWLAPMIIYAALIILTAISMPEDAKFRYPVSFLNFYENGLPEMLEWFVLIALLVLIYGFALYLVDCAISGKIAKHIVLPRVKTVVLEDDEAESTPKAEPVIERVEVKLEPMEPISKKSARPQAAKAAGAKKPKPQTTRPGARPASKGQGQKSAASPKHSPANSKNNGASQKNQTAGQKSPKVTTDDNSKAPRAKAETAQGPAEKTEADKADKSA